MKKKPREKDKEIARLKSHTYDDACVVCRDIADENDRLRKALEYVVDHEWAFESGDIKWLNEFVDVAKEALERKR